jgi:hypothetical protein
LPGLEHQHVRGSHSGYSAHQRQRKEKSEAFHNLVPFHSIKPFGHDFVSLGFSQGNSYSICSFSFQLILMMLPEKNPVKMTHFDTYDF